MLISFPPLNNMLKSSGSSCLSSGATERLLPARTAPTAATSIASPENFSSTVLRELVAHTEPNMLGVPALVAFKDPMIRGSAIHTAYRIFAAFFIDVGT